MKVSAIYPDDFYDGPLWSDPERRLFVQYLKSGRVLGTKTVADVREFYEMKVPIRHGASGTDILRTTYYIVEQAYETDQTLPVTGDQVMIN